MSPGPVFNLELRRITRRKRYLALLTLYGLVLIFVVWSNDPLAMLEPGTLSIDQRRYAGKSLFETYAIWQTAMVVLIAPGMVAGVIAEERERNTMSSLLVSPLTSGEIVLGKLCARLLHLACFVVLGMPILVLVKRFGGVGMWGVLLYFVGTATTAFFVGAISVLLSTQSRRARDAVVSAYVLVFAWHVVPVIVLVFLSGTGAPFRLAVEAVAWTCPLLVMLDNVRGTRFWESPNVGNSVRMAALQVVLGAVAATIAVRRLRPTFLKDESKPQGAHENQRSAVMAEIKVSQSTPSPAKPQPLRDWLHAASDEDFAAAIESASPEPRQAEPPPPPGLRPRPTCGDDAMLWKELWASPPGTTRRVLGGLALAAMLILAAWACLHQGLSSIEELLEHGYDAEFENSYHRLELNLNLRYLVTAMAGLMLLWVSSVAACSLAGERDRQTWLSLIATPLTGFEILRGKAIGALWSVRALLVLWLALVMIGTLLGAVHPLGALAATLATATYLAFGSVLGMVYSLRARTSSRAVAATLITLVILNGAYAIVFLPSGRPSTLVFLGVTPFVEASTLISYLDASWLLDFEAPEKRLLEIALACGLSVALYAVGAVVLAWWTVKSFDRVIDRPDFRTVIALHPAQAKPK